MALADLYLLVFKQTFHGKPFENTFTFQRADSGSTAVDLGNAFIADVIPAIAPIQVNDVLYSELVITNLGNLGDNANVILSGGGSYGNDNALPLLNAINYTFKPASRVVRPGSKRISGIPGIVVTDDFVTDATYIGRMNTLRGVFGAPISDGSQLFDFVVVKRVKEPIPDTEPQKYSYRLPTIGETPVVSELGGVLVNTRVSSQVSRKD